jgi:hypothetical protein
LSHLVKIKKWSILIFGSLVTDLVKKRIFGFSSPPKTW